MFQILVLNDGADEINSLEFEFGIDITVMEIVICILFMDYAEYVTFEMI